MRAGTTHGKQAKIRNTGRHAAHAHRRHARPAQLNKVVKRAAMVVPAVAVVSAAVATVQAHGQASAAPSDAAGRVTAGRVSTGHAGPHAGSAAGRSGRPASSSTALRAAKSRNAVTRSGAGRAAPRTGPSRPSAGSKPGSKPGSPHCSGSSVMLPENYAAIVGFLTTHGYTRFAAAGIAGNMYQESKGNPESVGTGGGGLIGWTPLPPGFVTGNPAADLRTQLAAVLTYNQQWSQYIPALNAATSATQAADIYMTYFERPGLPVVANREGAAAAVASACGF